MTEKFLFRAKDWQGKTIKGIVEAKDKREVISLLKKRSLIVVSLTPQKKSFFSQLTAVLWRRVSLDQVVSFTRRLATMISAGLPLTEALELAKEQNKGRMREIIEEALAKVEGGKPFGKALEKERRVLGDVYIASIKAGEEGGVLEEVLLRLAENLEKKREFLGKVKGAMIYPVIVIVGMVAVSFIMMIFVIPKMTSLYQEFGSDLPLATRILVNVANFVSHNIWLLPVFLISLFVGFSFIRKTPEGREKIDQLKLRLPIVGPLLKATLLTEITRTLATLLGTGVPLVDSLKVIGEAAGNEIFRRGLEQAAEAVEKGSPLSEALSGNSAFPPIIAQMIATGEQTGKLDEILFNVSKYFETEAEQKVKGLTSAIEPLIMIVLGLGVGFLVIAIILPIYNLTSQF